jgi:hypothetical protein
MLSLAQATAQLPGDRRTKFGGGWFPALIAITIAPLSGK